MCVRAKWLDCTACSVPGRTEVLRSIFGLDKYDAGEIHYMGKKVEIHSPQDAIRHGIAMVTEDRHLEGLVLDETVKFNMTLANLQGNQRGRYLSAHIRKQRSAGRVWKTSM